MIWLSEYRDVFIKNSFGLVYENSLLLTSINFRGDYKMRQCLLVVWFLMK